MGILLAEQVRLPYTSTAASRARRPGAKALWGR
jgi:hypothetical protein